MEATKRQQEQEAKWVLVELDTDETVYWDPIDEAPNTTQTGRMWLFETEAEAQRQAMRHFGDAAGREFRVERI